MTVVMAGTNIGWMNSEYRIDVLSTEDAMHENFEALNHITFSFMHTIG